MRPTRKSLPERLVRPQLHTERLLELRDRHQIRPHVTLEQRPDRRVLQVGSPSDLTHRALPHSTSKLTGNVLNVLRDDRTTHAARRPLPRREVAARGAIKTAVLRHAATVERPAAEPNMGLAFGVSKHHTDRFIELQFDNGVSK